MYEELNINSASGPYRVDFTQSKIDKNLFPKYGSDTHYLVDENIAKLYSHHLKTILELPSTLVIKAEEDSKSLRNMLPIFEHLVRSGVRRDHSLMAIGGGVIQDITCFISSVYLRGVPWSFLPTTLLSQADSCIGSKSSINLENTKNILGTFYPPKKIVIFTEFLRTLDLREIKSGIGEIIKVHAINGPESFDAMAADYKKLECDGAVLLRYIRSALEIKKRFIEVDEFDKGIRNIFNYGHSFGHAIEAATHYAIPHGIAVSMGMDMANSIALQRKILPKRHFDRMHGALSKNYAGYESIKIPFDLFIGALLKDKKNTSTSLGLIFAVGDNAKITKVNLDLDSTFKNQCEFFLAALKS